MWPVFIHSSMCRTHRWTGSMMLYWMGMMWSHVLPGTKSISEVFWRGPVNEEGKPKDVREPSAMADGCSWYSAWERRSSVFPEVLFSGSQSGVERNNSIGGPGNQKWRTHHCCYLQRKVSETVYCHTRRKWEIVCESWKTEIWIENVEVKAGVESGRHPLYQLCDENSRAIYSCFLFFLSLFLFLHGIFNLI